MNSAEIGVTDHRLRHFAWRNNPRYELSGWWAFVESVEPIDGGVLVSLRVMPSFTDGGGAIVVADYSIEKYTIVNGEVTFVGAVDPPGVGPFSGFSG